MVRVLSGSLDKRPDFVRLLAILHSILEQNVDPEAILRFKRLIKDGLLSAAEQLQPILPALRPEEIQRFLLVLYALLIGIQQLSDPNPAVRAVIDQPGLEIFKINFEPLFSSALAACLNGMLSFNGKLSFQDKLCQAPEG